MFKLTRQDIADCRLGFVCDADEQNGILRVLEMVREDLKKVFGVKPRVCAVSSVLKDSCPPAVAPDAAGEANAPAAAQDPGESNTATSYVYEHAIVCGCVSSETITALAQAAGIDTGRLSGLREVYLVEQRALAEGRDVLFVLGSDKRGSIYGLLHLSEMCGVSPFVNWADVMPRRRSECVIADADMGLSKEPSVRYRGFFINDEWPAFGTWATKRFGGFNAKCYAAIFELLLRLKGNYLWPAMWTGIFSEDGPGQASAELADELGVVMGTSHHEPCLRHGEEYKYLRGKDSIYGDAWNFRTNREGITRFWRDGLIRSGRCENVITVGMRGEADSTILAKDATLADNIDLLRDVLATQADLIRTYVNQNLDAVPRMLALYKEVEPFYYGDAETPGLMGDPLLDGVTLMLCDDNHGNLRTLPTEAMRAHKGGFGMYYHLDYHGTPISYEWVNSTSLTKIQDQMSNAFEFGIKNLWIVNVGDLFTNEFPLSYFLNLAYDYEQWGAGRSAFGADRGSASRADCGSESREDRGTRSAVDRCARYTEEFVRSLFGGGTQGQAEQHESEMRVCRPDACDDAGMTEAQIAETCYLLTEYTKIAQSRRPEAMNDEVYAPWAYKERETLAARCETLMNDASRLMGELSAADAYVFYEFVWYPLTANLNLQLMWLLTTYNHGLAAIGAAMANRVADRVRVCLQRDRELVDELHSIHDGRWYGMGLSEHIGFRWWNEETCRMPVLHTFEPANKPRIIAVIPETGDHTEGGFWHGKDLILPDFARYDVESARVDLYAASMMDAEFEITEMRGVAVEVMAGEASMAGEAPMVGEASMAGEAPVKGTVPGGGMTSLIVKLTSTVRNSANTDPADASGSFHIHSESMDTDIMVLARDCSPGYCSIEAAHYDQKKDGVFEQNGRAEIVSFAELKGFGKTLSGMKVLPVTADAASEPWLGYDVEAAFGGEYVVRVYLAPGNPPFRDNHFAFGVSANDAPVQVVQTVPEGFVVTDHYEPWESGVLNQIRTAEAVVKLVAGHNVVRLHAGSPGCTFEKLVMYPIGGELQASYLGPAETKARRC